MTKRILKYTSTKYTSFDAQTEFLAARGKILHADVQDDKFAVWVLTDSNETQTIKVRGTGKTIDDNSLSHIGTAIDRLGYVWHFFKVVEDE